MTSSSARVRLSAGGSLPLLGAGAAVVTLAGALLAWGDARVALVAAFLALGAGNVLLLARFRAAQQQLRGELRRTEEELASVRREAAAQSESEARLREFAAISSDWFWEHDAELRFTYFSGRNGAQHLGKRPWELDGDATSEEQWAAQREIFAAQRPFRHFRYSRVAPDGTTRWYAISGRPHFSPSGAFLGYRGTGRDITEQVKTENALRLAKEEAEAASRTKSQILANMSHELRTPLNAIIGFSEIIATGLMGPLEERYRVYAKDIHNAGSHLLKLITDVLDLSKLEVGQLTLHEAPVDLAEVIGACHRLIAQHAREAMIKVERVIPADLPPLLADELRLKQILLNLLSNAVKFTAAGGTGGRIRIEVARAPDGGVTLAVADTGIGMRAEDIPIALAPFRQVDGALNRRYEGTGLGLPLTKMLVELHGGTLEIDSEPDRHDRARPLPREPPPRRRGAARR